MHPYFAPPLPHIFAHRGFALRHSENSLEAFRAALILGATHIETDVHVTGDGIPVLFHDDKFKGKSISRLLKSDLPDFVPTLESALTEFPQARFNIDIKSAHRMSEISEVIINTESQQRVLITSFSGRRRKFVVKRVPGIATSASSLLVAAALFSASCNITWLTAAMLSKIDALQIPVRALGIATNTPRLIHRFKETGVLVYFWTINDSEEMKTLIRNGADGVVTDRTDLAVQALRS